MRKPASRAQRVATPRCASCGSQSLTKSRDGRVDHAFQRLSASQPTRPDPHCCTAPLPLSSLGTIHQPPSQSPSGAIGGIATA